MISPAPWSGTGHRSGIRSRYRLRSNSPIGRFSVCIGLALSAATIACAAEAEWLIMHKQATIPAVSVELAPNAQMLKAVSTGGRTNTLRLTSISAIMKHATEHERKMPTGTGPYFVELLSGERMRVENITFDGSTLSADHFFLGRLSWPGRKLKRLVRAEEVMVPEQTGFLGIRFRNGDTTKGRILSIGKGAAMVSMPDIGKIPVGDLDAVTAFVFASRRAGRRKFYFLDKMSVEIMLKNNEVIAGQLTGTRGKAWVVEPEWRDKAVELPVAFIRALTAHGTTVYLPDITPADQKVEPYLRFVIPWQRDRSLSGHRLRVGKLSAHRGLAMHSRTVLQYDLSGLTKTPVTFLTVVGMDSEVTGLEGAADVLMELDGKTVLRQRFTSASAPKPIRLPIPAGAKKMTISADFGPNGSIADHVDWLYPGFVKAK